MTTNETKPLRRVVVRPLGTLALAGGMAVALGAASGATGPAGTQMAPATPAGQLWLVSGTEGGEGGEGGAAPVATDDRPGLLVGLMKVEARTRNAVDLVAAGDEKTAGEAVEKALHGDFESMEPALKAHKAPLFEDELVALEKQVTKAPEARDAAVAALDKGLAATRTALNVTPAEEFAAVVAILREAGEDFGVGVKDGKLTEEPGEYRDARGYVLAADAALARLQGSSDATVKAAADKSRAALAPVLAALPDVAPKGTIAADPALILGAAASVELAAYKVK